MASSKGSADIWWIIIGAVIALVVLIVLLVIFTGKTGYVNQGLSSCEGVGYKCLSEAECSNAGGLARSGFDCKENTKCCFTVR